METAKIDVIGMMCGGCKRNVENALKGVDGVSEAEADVDAGTATVTYDSSKTNLDALKAAIVAADFQVK